MASVVDIDGRSFSDTGTVTGANLSLGGGCGDSGVGERIADY